jgi:hypothetical protein
MEDTEQKCCKKPICKPKENKCVPDDIQFYEDPSYWKLLFCLNVLIILVRYSYIKCKDKDFSLVAFLLWLELQIMLFFVVATSFVYVSQSILYLVELFFYYLKALFSKRKTPKIMKFLKLKKTDEVFFRLYCMLMLIICAKLIVFITFTYIALFFYAVFYVLGYAKI